MQILLSLFQGPTMALLLAGVLTRWATPASGLATLAVGVPLAALLTWLDWNMLYVAFVTFLVSMGTVIGVSLLTPRLDETLLDRLVFRIRPGTGAHHA
ncbi:MAG: hypothetical protein U5R48_03670 [Gammaproteobacteria bacterium]|nr:hypothetical protein [Gammaproteobacteria bacterium]